MSFPKPERMALHNRMMNGNHSGKPLDVDPRRAVCKSQNRWSLARSATRPSSSTSNPGPISVSIPGGRFLELLEAEGTLAAVLAKMLEEFDVTEAQLEADLLRLADEMLANDLLVTA